MTQVIVKQWFESEGGYGRTPRYSLHSDPQSCLAFVSEHENDRLQAEGKSFEADVDDETFDEVESADRGIWYAGKVRAGDHELDLSPLETD